MERGSASPRTQTRPPSDKKLSTVDVGADSASLPCSGHPPSDLCMTRQSHALPHISPMGSLQSDTWNGVRSSIGRFEPRGAAEMRVTPERLCGYSGNRQKERASCEARPLGGDHRVCSGDTRLGSACVSQSKSETAIGVVRDAGSGGAQFVLSPSVECRECVNRNPNSRFHGVVRDERRVEGCSGEDAFESRLQRVEAKLEDLVHKLATLSQIVPGAARAIGLDPPAIDAGILAAEEGTEVSTINDVVYGVSTWAPIPRVAIDPRCVCWACQGYSNGSEDSGRCQSVYTDELDVSRGHSSCTDENNDSQELESDGPYSEFNSDDSEDSRRGQSTCPDTHSDSQELERDGPYSDYDDTSMYDA